MPTRQVRNCRVGDILLFKNKESRLNTPVEQGFTWNSPSFEVILINRLV